jgi:hypothetical protein
MKKAVRFFLLPALLLFVCQNVFAQINVGVRAGVNFSNFRPNPLDYEPKPGINAALLLNVPLNQHLSLQVEPGYSQRGAKIDMDGMWLVDGVWQRTTLSGKISLGYIEVPLLLQYKRRIGKLEGIVSLGPEFRFSVGPQTVKSTNRNYKDRVLVEETYYDESVSNVYRAFDYGLAGGVGVAYPLSFGKVFAEARYHLGLRELGPNVEMKNRGMSAHIGVLIPLKK